MAEISPQVRELAGYVADEIERKGHYQGRPMDSRPETRCCLVAMHGQTNNPYLNDLTRAVVEVAGVVSVTEEDAGKEFVFTSGQEPWTCAIAFNDSVSTEEVLDVLRAIEVG